MLMADKAHDLPMPMMINEIEENGLGEMVAQYKLETDTTAVKAEHRKYVLMKTTVIRLYKSDDMVL